MRILLPVLLTAIMAASTAEDYPNDYVEEYTVKDHEKVVVCYWGTWANYRPGAGKFTPEDIDANLCTHLIYTFAGLDPKTDEIKGLDPWFDLDVDEKGGGLAGFRKATDLKDQYPHLKVSIAIGGWNEGSKNYSIMAADSNRRFRFVHSVVRFLKKHNFDGLDLDWEYPGKRGGDPENDKFNFVQLIKDLKEAFRPHQFLLTAAIGAATDTIEVAYGIKQMYKYLDYVHIMCYDYHGAWDLKTGHNAPLYPRPNEKGKDVLLNVDSTLEYLMKRGAKPEKTVLGVPLYGRAFLLMNPHDYKMGARAKAESFKGPYTREAGFLGYNEICEMLAHDYKEEWTLEWESSYMAPYMHKDLKWVSYDDPESIKIKADYAFKKNLAGVMAWSIETDDFMGQCGHSTFPLLRSINQALYRQEQARQGIAAGIVARPGSILAILVVTLAILNFKLGFSTCYFQLS